MNFDGLIVGAATFLIIGIFHPLVIKGEYYFGTRVWISFLIGGLIFTAGSLVIEQSVVSIIAGVIGFSCFWGIKEVFEQTERVRKGLYPSNPNRKK